MRQSGVFFKKQLLFLLPVMLTLLSGCGSVSTDRMDVERIMLIQTMGLDHRGTGIEMSVSTGLGPEDAPALVMSVPAAGMEAAIARLQNYSPENQLYYAHVQYLLLGRSAAEQDLDRVLEWVDRSPFMRMDTDLIIVDGKAEEAVTATSEGVTDVTERLESLEREARLNGWRVSSLREVSSALAEGRGALCLALRPASTEDKVFTQDMQSSALLPVGYAVLNGDGLAGILSPEDSLGAALFSGGGVGTLVTVDGCALELLSSQVETKGQWEDGALTGLSVSCRLRAGIMERSAGGDSEAMDQALHQAVTDWLTGAVDQARNMGCDFLDLRRHVLTRQRDIDALGPDWNAIFSALPLEVTVDAQVDRSYDLAE